MTTTREKMNGKPVFTVPGKTIVNFDSGFGKKLLCDGPVFNAGQACVYSCAFCYVESMERKQHEWFVKHGVEYPEDGHVGVVIRNGGAADRAREQLRAHPKAEREKKKVIYSSTKVDVAGNMELVRETIDICRIILLETNWDIRLLSKSNLLPKIAEALQDSICPGPRLNAKSRVIYGVSTGTLDDKIARAFEQGCPLVSKRIESLHWLQDNGYRTFGMICPSLPLFDYEFAVQARDAIRADRCEHVWAEVINVRGESFTRTEAALREAGYSAVANELRIVSHNPEAWEDYARKTFLAHVAAYVDMPGKLRYLQYVNKRNQDWWEQHISNGAVLL